MTKRKPHQTAESTIPYRVVKNRNSASTAGNGVPIRDEESEQLGKRLLEIIGEESIRAFAGRCGMSDRLLGAYTRGEKAPGVKHLVRLADAGGVTVDWIATGRGPKTRREVVMLIEAKTMPASARINAKALGMILGGILRGQEGRLDAVKAAVTAVEFYQDAIAEGLITPDGIGDGGKSAA